jgi:hypothetical protein
MSGGSHYFWLGASADADPALVASDQAASRLAPPGVDPLRVEAVLFRHAAQIKLPFVLDLLSVLGMRLVAEPIE